jgi:predicted nucleic acid-binding Zn ribbon protein
MSSNIDIQKKCMWCGRVFTAHKMSTSYCSHKCASIAYKDRVRKERVAAYQQELSIKEF